MGLFVKFTIPIALSAPSSVWGIHTKTDNQKETTQPQIADEQERLTKYLSTMHNDDKEFPKGIYDWDLGKGTQSKKYVSYGIMGNVFRWEDEEDDQVVKVQHTNYGDKSRTKFNENMESEHKNVQKIHELIAQNKTPQSGSNYFQKTKLFQDSEGKHALVSPYYKYSVQEFLNSGDGGVTSQWCDRAENLSLQLFEAVSILQTIGVPHRDIKAENIRVSEENGKFVLKLIDFGAKNARMSDRERALNVIKEEILEKPGVVEKCKKLKSIDYAIKLTFTDDITAAETLFDEVLEILRQTESSHENVERSESPTKSKKAYDFQHLDTTTSTISEPEDVVDQLNTRMAESSLLYHSVHLAYYEKTVPFWAKTYHGHFPMNSASLIHEGTRAIYGDGLAVIFDPMADEKVFVHMVGKHDLGSENPRPGTEFQGHMRKAGVTETWNFKHSLQGQCRKEGDPNFSIDQKVIEQVCFRAAAHKHDHLVHECYKELCKEAKQTYGSIADVDEMVRGWDDQDAFSSQLEIAPTVRARLNEAVFSAPICSIAAIHYSHVHYDWKPKQLSCDEVFRRLQLFQSQLQQYMKDNGCERHVPLVTSNYQQNNSDLFFKRHAFEKFKHLQSAKDLPTVDV